MKKIRPGEVLNLDEDDYKFGTGPLTVRVDEVLREAHLQDGCWLQLQGQVIHDGRPAEKRFLYVRMPDH